MMDAKAVATTRGLGLILLVLLAQPALAAAGDESAATKFPVAATVNGEPIYVGEIAGVLNRLKQVKGAGDVNDPKTQANALQQIINRRLITQMLKREGRYFTEQDIEKGLAGITAQAEAQQTTLDQLLARQGVSMDTARYEVMWQIGWNHYIERNLTDQLHSYFEANRKDFDGTRVRASHILLRAERAGETNEELKQRAERIREAIEAEKIAFEQAAERYSIGPSRTSGGDLGFFPRFGVMIEGFAKAAFALEKGRLSEPVVTPFGVHLIRVTDIKPGTKQWTEVLDQMRVRAAVEMFQKLAEKEAEDAQIEYTGKIPYLDPDTEKIVLPPARAK